MPPADKLLNNEYRMRINRTIDYIRAHYAEDLSLEKLASIACFSKFHFHRLFRAVVGETLNDYVQRIRLENPSGNSHPIGPNPLPTLRSNAAFPALRILPGYSNPIMG